MTKPDAATILVEDIPLTATADSLKTLFADIGEARRVSMKTRTKENGRTYAFAFVQFASREVALRVIQEKNYAELE
jgi:RNA recognition motif-containing protein